MARNKYGNRRVDYEGLTFASTAEFERYLALRQMQTDGLIEHLTLQPVYVLQEKFRHGGKTIAAVTYVGDFQYSEGVQTVCEDVKGVRTAVFNVKWKLAMARYPNIDFRIVQA